MGRQKKVEKSKSPKDKIEYEKILGECHDGEYYNVLLKDGTEKLIPKWLIDKEK